jgi:hypothetical protein
MVVKWWSNGGQMVAKWWSNGGQMVAKWWSNGGQMVVKATDGHREGARAAPLAAGAAIRCKSGVNQV